MVLPNGLCVVNGPFLGNEHDSTMMLQSRLEDELQTLTALLHLVHPLCMYGDSAYAESIHLVRAVPYAQASPAVRRLNDHMKKIR